MPSMILIFIISILSFVGIAFFPMEYFTQNDQVGSDTTACNNLGAGFFLCTGGNINLRTLIGGENIVLTATPNDITISALGETKKYKTIMSVGQDVTKTNIGTAYVDIYVTAFDEQRAEWWINCANMTRFAITYQWDYVGVGTQQVRWVDVSNNANVLFEAPTTTTDQDSFASFNNLRPSWCTTITQIEWQGKSTTGTDDPIAKGYKIMAY